MGTRLQCAEQALRMIGPDAGFYLGAHFFASGAGESSFQDRSHVWHGRIAPSHHAGVPAVATSSRPDAVDMPSLISQPSGAGASAG